MTRRIIATALHITLLLVALAAMLPASTFPVAAQGSASITILLRGCPDGVDPQAIANPAAECTVPLDAPDEAGVFWGGDGQGGMPLADTERLNNGSYRVTIPANQDVTLFNFDPTVRDSFAWFGVDSVASGEATINLADGEHRDIAVYYYNAVSAPTETTLDITLRGCAEGINPLQVADPAAECTIPLDAPEEAGVFWGGDGQGGMPLADTQRKSDGTYSVPVPAGMRVNTFNFEPTVFDTYTVVGADSVVNGEAFVTLTDGETRSIVFYYYHLPEGTATLNIILRGCAEGIDPQTVADPAAECTIPLDAPDDAGVFWGGDGQGGMPLADTERLNNGTYTMLAPAGMSIQLFGFDPTVYDAYVVLGTDGQIDNEPMVILAPNETRTVEIYYVHH